MIEFIEGMPENVIAVRLSGVIEEEDYGNVLIPAVKDKVKKFGKIRLLYDVQNFKKFSRSAMLEDMKLGVENFNSFEKIAVVADVGWMIDAVEAFKHIMPGTVKTYKNEELSEAEAWISK